MKEVVLAYTKETVNLEKEAMALSVMGLFVKASFDENKIHATTLFNEGKLEKIFTKDVIANFEKHGVSVEIVE